MSPLDVLQMLGRAGRPGYDDKGYAHVVCEGQDAEKYRRLLREGKEIESRLAAELDSHLNAEIALGTIRDLDDVMEWLQTTFYYVRAQSAPDQYRFGGKLRERVRETLQDLVASGFVETDDELRVEGTPLGRLASKFYLRLDTARGFADLAENAGDIDADDILAAVASAGEFDSVSARKDERDAVSAVLGSRGEDLESGARKVFAILHASMNGTTPTELKSDAWVIRQNALRMLAALRAFLDRFAGARAANLACRVEARVEHGISADAVGRTAIDGVGAGRARKLAAAGLASPRDVRSGGEAALTDAGLSEGVAERILESVDDLPIAVVEWGSFPDSIGQGENSMEEVRVRNVSGGARAGIRVTVNGIEMSSTDCYLGERTVPVGVFGGDAEELTFTVEISFPALPLAPVTDSRTVDIV